MSSLQLAHTARPNSGAEAIACSDGASPSKTSTDAPCSWRNEFLRKQAKKQNKTKIKTRARTLGRIRTSSKKGKKTIANKEASPQRHQTLKEKPSNFVPYVSFDSRFSGST